jgi:chromosome segregation ATPase
MADSVNTDQRLAQINDELSKLLEERIEFLTKTLAETQRFTHKIASTELEIQRNASQHVRFKEECESLEKELATLSDRVREVSGERDGRQNEKYAKEKEIQRLEWEIQDARKGIAEASEKSKALQKEKDLIEAENVALQGEVSELEGGVAELRKLRDRLRAKRQALNEEVGGGPGGEG